MGTIRLNPLDAERYGAPEVIDFDLRRIGVRQRGALEKATKHSLRWMLDQLSGVPEVDDVGNVIVEHVLNDDGTQKLNADGSPELAPKLGHDADAVAMIVWLALWGAGIRVAWEGFDVTEIGLRISLANADEDDEEPEGKGGPAKSSALDSTTAP